MAGPLAVVGGAVLVGLAMVGIEPAAKLLNRWVYTAFPTAIPQIPELVDMRYRGVIDEPEYLSAVRANGLNPEWSENVFQAAKQLFTAGDIVAAFRRGFIDSVDMQNRLDQIHISGPDQKLVQQVLEFFPSPPDLVRFAVREVYTPEVVEKFGMLEDLPPRFLEEAAKAGLPQEQAENFWAAHWVLPSPLQGFRMLHRGIATEDELKLLLKSLDVMPFWRDKMIKLSFNPLTRVDVRRMYGLNVLDADGVFKAYKDIGYNDENAKLMTEFTVKFQNDENKGITRSSVVSAYKKGSITEQEMKDLLTALRFSPKVVDFWVNTSMYEKVEKDIDNLVDTDVKMYAEGLINRATLEATLNSYSFPATYTADIMKRADLERRKKRKMPSKADLIKWAASNILSIDEFNLYMVELGYRQEDIDLYVQQISQAVQTGEE